MSHSPLVQAVAAATSDFVAQVLPRRPARFEAKVASGDGMPLLCAVERALALALPCAAAQELVWVMGCPVSGAHQLRLQAFGKDNVLLGEAVHEFARCALIAPPTAA